MRGLVALQFARESELKEPQRGYNIPGISFTANQLFHEIRQHVPDFCTTVAVNTNMDKFARLWPDTLSGAATRRDLEYEPLITLPRMVAQVLNAHTTRTSLCKAAFRTIATDDTGRMSALELELYVRRFLVRGREAAGYVGERRQDLVMAFVEVALAAMDVDQDGMVSLEDFMIWSWNNNIESMFSDFMAAQVPVYASKAAA